MGPNSLRIASLNVNGMRNPVKRSRVMSKMKKDRTQIIFLQETHMTKEEHKKLKKFGYFNVFSSSCKNSRKRGVAILISSSLSFDLKKEERDKEGRYVLIKCQIENRLITLVNIYAPPESDGSFFKEIFDKIASESEGILICAGDWNTVLNYSVDTTSKRQKSSKSKDLNILIKETGTFDVWRDLHRSEKEYTHYSAAHKVHSRIDYFLMNKSDRYRVNECSIGTADVSDHNIIYLHISLENKPKKTLWRLNISVLNNESAVKEIKKEITECISDNQNDQVNPNILWDTVKAIMRGKLISRTAYLKKKKKAEYDKLIVTLRNLEKQQPKNGEGRIIYQIKEVKKK